MEQRRYACDLHQDSAGQRTRMAEEIRYLVDRALEHVDDGSELEAGLRREAAWWMDPGLSLLDAVVRSFMTRQLLVQLEGIGGTWRNSLSYIGEPVPSDQEVCTYEYDRAAIALPSGSALARPYEWVEVPELAVDAFYTRNGMTAITAWLLALARMANEQQRPYIVLTNRLYHETIALFEQARLRGVQIQLHQTLDPLLETMNTIDGNVVVFLDSSRPDGGSEALASVLRCMGSRRGSFVVWDNTCAPAADHPFGDDSKAGDLAVPLVVIRSHAKLDQAGLELCPLGSLALVTRIDRDEDTFGWKQWRKTMRRFVAEAISATGACVSPVALRLLSRLGLPHPELSKRANECVRAANELGGKLLRAELATTACYRVETNEHKCFVEIHLDEVPGAPADLSSGYTEWPVWDVIEHELTAIQSSAADLQVPVWKSVSFGFHYTAMSWYESNEPPRPQGCPHTVLRVCFGMHDPPVTTIVSRVIARHLQERKQWTTLT